MTDRWRRNWRDLASEVIDLGLCTGCSGCVVACPQGVLHLDRETWIPGLDSDAWHEDQDSYCRFGDRGCTLCARACPRLGAWETEADLARWSRTRRVDEVLGVYRRILMVDATDRAVAAAGQDGGLGTAMLLYAIEKGYIDGALISQYDEKMNTRPGIARTREELLACAGSRYTYSPNLLAIKEADRAMRIGLISVGCQVSVPAIAKSRGANKLAKRFELVVGLLCSRRLPTASTRICWRTSTALRGTRSRRSTSRAYSRFGTKATTPSRPMWRCLSRSAGILSARLLPLSRFRGPAR